MSNVKYFLVLAVVAVCLRSSQSFFLHKKVVEIPVQLKPVHLQPVLIQPPTEIHEIHHIEEPSTPAPSTTPHPKKQHWQNAWNSVKSTVGNHKIVKHFYHKKEQQPTPAPSVWSSHGHGHFQKISYIPVFPISQVPIQNEFEYIPHDFAHPIVQDTFQFDTQEGIPQDFQSVNNNAEVTSILTGSIPKDVNFSVSGDQTNKGTPIVDSEQSVKVIPNPPSLLYGLPPSNI